MGKSETHRQILAHLVVLLIFPVEYIPNCPLQGTGILSGRGSQHQKLRHIDPRGNIQGQLGNARSHRLECTPFLSILADRSHVS